MACRCLWRTVLWKARRLSLTGVADTAAELCEVAGVARAHGFCDTPEPPCCRRGALTNAHSIEDGHGDAFATGALWKVRRYEAMRIDTGEQDRWWAETDTVAGQTAHAQGTSTAGITLSGFKRLAGDEVRSF